MTGRVFPEDGSWPRARVTPLDQKKMKQLIDAANELIEEVGIAESYFLIFGEEMISPPVQDLPD